MPDYISNITTLQGNQVIGGKNFDGDYSNCWDTVCSNVTIAAGKQIVYDISSYLPDDGYDYELYFMIAFKCTAKAGTSAIVYLYSGDSISDYDYYCGAPVVAATTHSIAQESVHCAFLPVKASRRKVVLYNSYTYDAQGVCLYLRGYRRLGNNNDQSDYISNINVKGENIPIGGDVFDSQWKQKYLNLASKISIASNASITYDISSYLPNDNNSYELLIRGWGNTSSTSNRSARFKVMRNIQGTDIDAYIGGARSTNSSQACFGGSCTIVVDGNTRQLSLINTGTDTMYSGTCDIISYRKLGNNDDSKQYVDSINVLGHAIEVGGSNFDGPWIDSTYSACERSSFVSGTVYNADISSYIPNDGHDYELLIYAWVNTQTSAGRVAELYVGSDIAGDAMICRTVTRSSSSIVTTGVCKIPISGQSRVLKVINNCGVTTGKGKVWLCGYRRLGTNK